MELEQKEIDIVSHALGLNHAKEPCRNHFVPGGNDIQICQNLKNKGLMTSFKREWIDGEVFQVTEKGKEVLSLINLDKVRVG